MKHLIKYSLINDGQRIHGEISVPDNATDEQIKLAILADVMDLYYTEMYTEED